VVFVCDGVACFADDGNGVNNQALLLRLGSGPTASSSLFSFFNSSAVFIYNQHIHHISTLRSKVL
jgi:hypothetical protein